MEDEHCGAFIETPFEQFKRIGMMFVDGSETQVIHGTQDMDQETALKLWGLGS
jgi:hypothetical protein